MMDIVHRREVLDPPLHRVNKGQMSGGKRRMKNVYCCGEKEQKEKMFTVNVFCRFEGCATTNALTVEAAAWVFSTKRMTQDNY